MNTQSDPGSILLMRFGASLWWFSVAWIFSTTPYFALAISAFAVLAGIFFASLATIRLRDNELCYRRLWKWVAIKRADVVSSGAVWPPFMGYVRLTHYVPPWGMVFFVLDENRNPNLFGKGEFYILQYLKSGPGAMIAERVEQPALTNDWRWSLTLLISGAGTAFLGYFLRAKFLTGIEVPQDQNLIEEFLDSPGAGIILTSLFVILAFKTNGARGYGLSFFSGITVFGTLYRVIEAIR